MRFHFLERALGDAQKLLVGAAILSPEAFCNIGRNGNGSTSDLTRETVDFFLGPAISRLINGDNHFHCLLPNKKITIRIDCHDPPFSFSLLPYCPTALLPYCP